MGGWRRDIRAQAEEHGQLPLEILGLVVAGDGKTSSPETEVARKVPFGAELQGDEIVLSPGGVKLRSA